MPVLYARVKKTNEPEVDYMAEQDNPFFLELNGRVNGQPHTIGFDVKARVAESARLDGRNMSDEEIEAKSLEIIEHWRRVKELEPVQMPGRPLRGILKRIVKR